MRLTIRTNLATRILMYCAVNSGRTVRSIEVAAACNASGNHLSQVINQLQQAGFITTLRGRMGGLHLSRAATEICIGDLFRQFEATLSFTECFNLETNSCPLVDHCRLRGYLSRAIEAFYAELDRVTLDDLVQGNCGLAALLSAAPESVSGCQVSPPDQPPENASDPMQTARSPG